MSFRTLIIFEAIIIKIHNFYDEVNWVIIAVFETKQKKKNRILVVIQITVSHTLMRCLFFLLHFQKLN